MGRRLFALAITATLAPLTAQKVGSDAPDIAWTATHNFGDIASKRLSELRGSVILLEFVSVQQAAATGEVLKLDALHDHHVELGLVVISVTSEAADAVAKWVKRHDVHRPVAVGFNSDYDVRGVPDAFLIDKDFKVAWHGHAGGLDRTKLDAMLIGARPAVALPGLEEAQAMRRSKDYGATYKKAQELLARGGMSERATAQAKDWLQQYEKFVADAILAADAATVAKDPFRIWEALQPVADWYQGVPGADAAKVRFDALMADPKVKKEVEAGKKLVAAKAREAEYDFDGAYAIFKEVANAFSNTKPGRDAAAAVKAYEKDGKLGYDHKCGYCKAGGVACPTHKKKKK